jgi:hypothetical protein
MNTLFMCQSGRIKLFYKCMQKIRNSNSSGKFGFYVTDSRVYDNFNQKYNLENQIILKEWELMEGAHKIKPDIELLKNYEKELGDPFLWSSIVSDRRIYLGKKYAYGQDYKPRYDHDMMMSILQVSLIRMEELFDKVKPECVVTFQCVTMGEYLSYFFAKNRNIVFLNLRPTRIKNYIYAGESITEPSKDLEMAYLRLFEGGVSAINDSSIEYLNQVKKKNAMYEGVIPPTKNSPIYATHKKKVFGSLFSPRKGLRLLRDELSYRYGKLRFDNQVSGPISSILNQYIYRPIRIRQIDQQLNNHYVNTNQLQNIDYAFFPLHTEPEVTLLVYSKPYMNQIEVIRLISHSLPVGMKLLVKEHPWNVGKRKLGYFKKLLEIPNVMIASPDTESRDLINHSKLVTVISGSIAMEAMILEKPAIVLGRAPFNFLPRSMMKYVSNPDMLDFEIHDLLEKYSYDEIAIKSYVQAVKEKSVGVDFYSVLMDRKEAYNPKISKMSKVDLEKEKDSQIEKLAGYLIQRYHELKNTLS